MWIDNMEGEHVLLESQSTQELERIAAQYRDSINRQYWTGPLDLYEQALIEIEDELSWRAREHTRAI